MGAGVSGLPVGIGPGSAASRTSNAAADSFVSELGQEVRYDKSMGSSRFIKTIRARHKQGPLVVKVFVKPDVSLSLKQFYRRLKNERDALVDTPNVLAYQRLIETERTGYLIRQWVASNLYDRISTRPFLSNMEKKWIAFQLLTALKAVRDKNLYHGDIKTENVLVTSWNWVYLTDLASFKPTYLPLDDPSTYTYFFDTSQRRTCYIAPERFFEPGSDVAVKKAGLSQGKRDGKVTEAMDIFSLGCVLAELWLEGTPPFSLTQLFQYRKGEYDPLPALDDIDDVSVREMIKSMLCLDPGERLSCAQYLDNYTDRIFPESFAAYFHPFFSAVNETTTAHSAAAATSGSNAGSTNPATAQAQTHVSPARHLDDNSSESKTSTMRLDVPGLEDEPVRSGSRQGGERLLRRRSDALLSQETDDVALIVLAFVSAHARNCQRPATTLKAIELLLAMNRHISDATRLDRLLPYLVSLLQDDAAAVRAAALHALTATLELVTSLAPANSSVLTEYVLPNTRPLAADVETLPRVAYAQDLAKLANTAVRFLEMTEALKTQGKMRNELQDFDGQAAESYDSRLSDLHAMIGEHVTYLLTDSSDTVRRALLENINELCRFFGRVKSNDTILSHLITYLNIRDWQLRATWCEQAVELATSVGPTSLEEYILPLLTLSLADAEEMVIHAVLTTLRTLVERGLLARGRVWELVPQTVGLLCHPNIWIREGTAAFLATVSASLETTDRWCILYPIVKKLLRADVKEITDIALLDNAREPLSRNIFEAAVAWAMRAPKSHFWAPPKVSSKGAPRDASVRTDEDHAQLERLRSLGMKPEDEYKLGQLRDHITKVAIARHSSPSRSSTTETSLPDATTLQTLGVVPQTIVLSIKSTAELVAAAQRIEPGSRRVSMDAPSSVHGRQPVEDLRRRLAMTGVSGSSSSVSGLRTPPVSDDHAFTSTNDSPASPGSLVGTSTVHHLERTMSQTSTSTDDLSDTPSHLQSEGVHTVTKSRVHGGAVDVGPVTAAIAHDSTTAVGLLEARAKDDDTASGIISTPPRSNPAFRPPEQRLTSTYEGNDPNIKQLLERTYLDSYREPSVDLGPFVHAGIPRRRAVRSSLPRRDRSSPRPNGNLIGHLVEHTGAITSIQVSPDHVFVATGSEDGTVKIWDTMRFEKNVTSRSRQSWEQGGRVTAVHILAHSHCVASASTNGTVWIHRIDVSLSGPMPKYGKSKLVRQHTVDGKDEFVTCMTSFNTDTSKNLVLATSQSRLIVLDVQTMRHLQEFALPIQHGPISAVYLDPSHVWLVGGTLTGVLFLWDLRFNLLLRTWKSARGGRINEIALHPTKGKGRWIVVSSDGAELDSLMEVWDIDQAVRVEEYRVAPSGQQRSRHHTALENGMVEAWSTPAAAIESILSSSTVAFKNRSTTTNEVPLKPNAKALIVGSEYSTNVVDEDRSDTSGFIVTAGEDRKLRFWDLGKPERSVVVSGQSFDEDKTAYVVSNLAASGTSTKVRIVTEVAASTAASSATTTGGGGATGASSNRSRTSGKMHRSTVIANSQQHLLRAHQESITALALVDLPFRCIVSGDRSGVLKVFE